MIENPDGSVPPPAPSGGFVLPEDQKEVGTVQLYNYCPAILLYYYTTILLYYCTPNSPSTPLLHQVEGDSRDKGVSRETWQHPNHGEESLQPQCDVCTGKLSLEVDIIFHLLS